MNTVQQFWESYQSIVIARDAPEVQIKETKRAFYAGSAAALALFDAIGQDIISNDGKDAMIEGLLEELWHFKNSVDNGAD